LSGETISQDIEFQCPACRGRNTVTLWPRIDAESAPELMDRLYAGTLFDHVCAHCYETSSLDHTVLVEMDAAKTALLNAPPNDPLAQAVNRSDPALGEYRLRRVTDSNALRELALALHDGLDDSAMLLLKHMLAARVMQDRGEPPVLLAYESTMQDGSREWLEYMLFQTEESDAETLTVPMAVYNDVLRTALPHQEDIFPAGKWVDWNDETAQRVWERVQQKVESLASSVKERA
jgi:hypothetical protein